MTDIPMKSVTYPGLNNKYLIPEIDSGLNTTGKAADSKVTGDKLNAVNSRTATTETTNTASKNYAKDSYLIYNDKLCKTKAAISSGGTISSSNVEETDIATELSNILTFVKALQPTATAGAHNGIYRGKDISAYLTDGTLWKRLKGSDGYTLFEDLFIGDYIVVNGRSYTLADFDYYFRTGSANVTAHHVVVIPTTYMTIPEGTALYGLDPVQTLSFINTENAGVTVTSQETSIAFKWNATMEAPNTSTTAGGYKYSRMRTVIMKACETLVITDFGSTHVKPIAVYYPDPADATASGIASNWADFNQDDRSNILCKSICDLMNETQVYGQQVWGQGSDYQKVPYEIGIDKFQFAIFALQRDFANIRAYWWLRSVSSATYVARVSDSGLAYRYDSAYTFRVRPRFLLVG